MHSAGHESISFGNGRMEWIKVVMGDLDFDLGENLIHEVKRRPNLVTQVVQPHHS
jgi:hypothetical protein